MLQIDVLRQSAEKVIERLKFRHFANVADGVKFVFCIFQPHLLSFCFLILMSFTLALGQNNEQDLRIKENNRIADSLVNERNLFIGKLHDEILKKGKYDRIDSCDPYDSNCSCVIVGKNEKFGVVNNDGVETVPVKYDKIERFNSRMHSDPINSLIVYKNNKIGIVNGQTGKIILPIEYSSTKVAQGLNCLESDYLLKVEKNNKWGAVNVLTGKITIPVIYSHLGGKFYDCICEYSIDNLEEYGYIDINGNIVVPYTYFKKERQSGIELINVQKEKDGKWGYFDIHGKMIISLQFDEPAKFENGIAKVIKDGKAMKINLKGEVIE